MNESYMNDFDLDGMNLNYMVMYRNARMILLMHEFNHQFNLVITYPDIELDGYEQLGDMLEMPDGEGYNIKMPSGLSFHARVLLT